MTRADADAIRRQRLVVARTKWDMWHPAEVARRLAGVEVPWCVTAGWAIDLFLAGPQRRHGDLEIAVPRDRFEEIANALEGLEFYVPGRVQGIHGVWPVDDERLDAHHQTWVREPETNRWRLDVFREPAVNGTWICRRDERIRLPYGELIELTEDGIPYARPDVVLLFKARHAWLDKNRRDFAVTLPRLSRDQRAWLAWALEILHPFHPWLERVRD